MNDNQEIQKAPSPQNTLKSNKWRNQLSKGKFRNDPCPCGSMKKIKRCHGKDSVITAKQFASNQNMIKNYNKRYKDALESHNHKEAFRLSIGDLSGGKEEKQLPNT